MHVFALIFLSNGNPNGKPILFLNKCQGPNFDLTLLYLKSKFCKDQCYVRPSYAKVNMVNVQKKIIRAVIDYINK